MLSSLINLSMLYTLMRTHGVSNEIIQMQYISLLRQGNQIRWTEQVNQSFAILYVVSYQMKEGRFKVRQIGIPNIAP